MERNALDEVVQWKVRWFAPFGKCRNEKASFNMLSGNTYLEVIDVDPEMLVASTPKLVNNNKKLPATVIKDTKAALEIAVIAEANGEVSCNACHEDKPDEELIACGCCHRCYHVCCVPANDDNTAAEWWCPECASNAQ